MRENVSERESVSMQLCVCVSASVFGVSARASAKKEQLLREEETQLLLLFVQADKEADRNMQIVLFVLLLFLLLRDKLFANWATPWTFNALPLSPFLPLTASLSVPCFLCLSLI